MRKEVEGRGRTRKEGKERTRKKGKDTEGIFWSFFFASL